MKTFIVLLTPADHHESGEGWRKVNAPDAGAAVSQVMADLRPPAPAGGSKRDREAAQAAAEGINRDEALVIEVVQPIAVVRPETRWAVAHQEGGG